MDAACSVCHTVPVVARGWCSKHYQRYRKYGNPNTAKFIRANSKVGSKEYFKECSTETPGPLETDCWLWGKAIDDAGYGRFGKRSMYAHRESYVLFRGSVPDGELICHRCDIRSCVNPEHLFVGTYQDNNDDMISKGRDRKFMILTDEEVVIIRGRALSGERHKDIAKDFGIAVSTVSAIKTGSRRGK